jgi:hypothetical protein
MIKTVLASAAIALGAMAATTAVASAEPNPFGTLGCSCTQPPGISNGKPGVKDLETQGIQNGLGSLHGGASSNSDF